MDGPPLGANGLQIVLAADARQKEETMGLRDIVRTALLAGLLLTPAVGATGEPRGTAALSRPGALLPRLIDSLWRLPPWLTASSGTPPVATGVEGEAPEPSSGDTQDAEGGPGWNPDGLNTGPNDPSSQTTSSSPKAS
jgi:hypothetical protein